MLLIGSKALCLNFNINPERFERSDFDVILTEQEFTSFVENNKSHIRKIIPRSSNKFLVRLEDGIRPYIYELEIDYKESAKWLLSHKDIVSSTYYTDPLGNTYCVANSDVLFALKKSHIHFGIHYDKNISDYLFLRDNVDLSKCDVYEDFFKLRNNEVKERVNKSLPKLNKTNEDFFNRSKDIVGYIFEHDDIHEAIKHYERPVYEMMKRDFSLAWCEKDMFECLPFEYKVRCVQEEAYVIALERFIILEKGDYKDYQLAYKAALQRICTTLCSGFFRDFAVNNYFTILDAYDKSFVLKFKEALFNGKVSKMKDVPMIKVEKVFEKFLSI